MQAGISRRMQQRRCGAVRSRGREWRRSVAVAARWGNQLEELDLLEPESEVDVEAGAGLLSAAGLLSVAGADLAASPVLDSDEDSEDAVLFEA